MRVSMLGRLNRYQLRLLLPPFALTLGVLMVALILGRLLQLFNTVARAGGAFDTTLRMVADLVPFYLGLALPAAFFVSVFMVVAKLGDDNELDAFLAVGRSIAQVSAPFLVLGVVLGVFCVYLYGFVQPYGRYGFHAERYAMQHATWDARVQAHTFIATGRGFTLSADSVDPTGRQMQGVFLQQTSNSGNQLTVTAERGQLIPTADGRQLILQLQHGRMWRQFNDGTVGISNFKHGAVDEHLDAAAPPFRSRGDAERELALPELWQQMHSPAPSMPHAQLAGEFYARIARALLLPLLPLLAVSLGMAAKRGRRTPGVIVAVIVVLAVHYGMGFGVGLAKNGDVPVVVGVWTPWVLFAAISLWLFYQSLKRPGDNPLTRAISRVEELIEQAGVRRRQKPA